MLADIQRLFANKLFSDEQTDTQALFLNPTALTIYQNNVFTGLTNALKEIYPAVYKIVGDDFFQKLAHDYIKAYPSQQSDLNQYGNFFSTFITRYAPAKNLIYLAEIAQLEWAYHEVFYAAQYKPLDNAALAQIPDNQYEQLTFQLNPAYRLLSFQYPVLKIWHLCQTIAPEQYTVNLAEGGIKVLVRKEGLDVIIEPLTLGEFTLLSALKAGTSVASACELALTQDSNLAINFCLQKFIIQGMFTHFSLPV